VSGRGMEWNGIASGNGMEWNGMEWNNTTDWLYYLQMESRAVA
jgi:hypothetical protein